MPTPFALQGAGEGRYGSSDAGADVVVDVVDRRRCDATPPVGGGAGRVVRPPDVLLGVFRDERAASPNTNERTFFVRSEEGVLFSVSSFDDPGAPKKR
jgi:hypothetical protein